MPLGPESGVLSNPTITESQNREGDWGATKMAIRESRKIGDLQKWQIEDLQKWRLGIGKAN